MEKEVKCPWCKEKTVPKVSLLKKQLGDVKERRCTECGKVLAAYLEEEGDFLPEMRTF
jgi:phage FluMu protein Com